MKQVLVSLVFVALASCSGQIDGSAPEQTRPQAPGTPGHLPEASGDPPGATAVGEGVGPTGSSPMPPPRPSPAAGETAGGPAPPAPPAATAGPSGLLGCPTVDYPGGALPVPALSARFTQLCAQCHGGAGQGWTSYPALPGSLSDDQFLKVVREGRAGTMPAFPVGTIDDATLRADLAALRGRPAGGAFGGHPALTWSQAEVAEHHRRGMTAWRKPDQHGAACASCHTPDAIDLAVIGYPDATVLRRAASHVPPEDAEAIVGLVHAQRRRLQITRPCSPLWRPFQPGGEVLPGRTSVEQDLTFLKELQSRGILVATGPIRTADDAERSWQQLATLDLRRVPIAIPLSRWTEDRFNGEAHRTFDEWISVFPRRPRDGRWYAAVDEYLADPSDQRFVALYRSMETLTTDDGATAKGNTASGDSSFSNLWIGKSHAVLLASHIFRRVLGAGDRAWIGLSEPPWARQVSYGVIHGLTFNPMQSIGQPFQEDHCYGSTGCQAAQTAALPEGAKLELGIGAMATVSRNNFPAHAQMLTHPWWTMALLYDPTLTYNFEGHDRRGESGGGIRGPRGLMSFDEMQYWAEKFGTKNFPQAQIHKPFLFGVNYIKRCAHFDRTRKAGEPTGVLDRNVFPGADNIYIMLGFDFRAYEGSPNIRENHRFVLNLMRTVLFQMRKRLEMGERVAEGGLGGAVGKWVKSIERLVARSGSGGPSDEDRALARDTLALAADVLARGTSR